MICCKTFFLILFGLNFNLRYVTCLQDAKALNVIIDPGLAFGTGEHPTTRLCLQWLHHVVNPGEKILDYGTGSGILCIAALKVIARESKSFTYFFYRITLSSIILTKLAPSRWCGLE